MQCTINTNVCVCSSHPVTGHLMLIAVDQKNRTLENLQPLAQACTQKVEMGGSNSVNSRSQLWGSGGAAPSRCSLSHKRQS